MIENFFVIKNFNFCVNLQFSTLFYLVDDLSLFRVLFNLIIIRKIVKVNFELLVYDSRFLFIQIDQFSYFEKAFYLYKILTEATPYLYNRCCDCVTIGMLDIETLIVFCRILQRSFFI